jgi:hypothetical protein
MYAGEEPFMLIATTALALVTLLVLNGRRRWTASRTASTRV